jgi:hypothetical protein
VDPNLLSLGVVDCCSRNRSFPIVRWCFQSDQTTLETGNPKFARMVIVMVGFLLMRCDANMKDRTYLKRYKVMSDEE